MHRVTAEAGFQLVVIATMTDIEVIDGGDARYHGDGENRDCLFPRTIN